MITKINNLSSTPYLVEDQRIQARTAKPLDQLYSSSLASPAANTHTCDPPQYWHAYWYRRCAVKVIEPIFQFFQWFSRAEHRTQIGVGIALNLIIITTAPIWFPAIIVMIITTGIAHACYKNCTKAIAYFKARNLNEEDKKLVDLKFSDSNYLGFQSLHRTLKDELKVKVFQKAHDANEKWYTVIPNDPDWFYHIVKNCPRNEHPVHHITCEEYPYFWDALDELIAEKINKS